MLASEPTPCLLVCDPALFHRATSSIAFVADHYVFRRAVLQVTTDWKSSGRA